MNFTPDVVAAVNDEQVFQENLMRSPKIANGQVRVLAERKFRCAGAAYNAGLAHTSSDIVVFIHQDVYLPIGWFDRLERTVSLLEQKKLQWAVLGVWGVNNQGTFAGRVWCQANNCEFSWPCGDHQEVVSIDEIVIILKRSSELQFDERMPAFHLYGTDIVQEARRKGFKAFVFDAPVVHNTRTIIRLDHAYCKAYRFMQQKWANALPIPTSVLPITRFGWPLYRRRLRKGLSRFRTSAPIYSRQSDPEVIAERLGYGRETTEMAQASSTL